MAVTPTGSIARRATAIIPARGGSKGIPGKNVRPLAGKPLIGWTIESAIAARSVDRVLVSTDDSEIADVARSFGAQIVDRPPELATDRAPSELALLHTLEIMRRDDAALPDAVAFLQCTAPLTLPADIDGTVRKVLDDGYDSAVTMAPFHYFVWRDVGHGGMRGVNHVADRRAMRQERTPEWLEVGAVYAMMTDGFLKHRFRFFGRVGRYELPPWRAIEIDEPEDWPRAEALVRLAHA